MANVLPHPHHLEFHTRQVAHAPTPLGFGFGLSTASTSTNHGYAGNSSTSYAPLQQQIANAMSQSSTPRPQKRRHDPDEELENESRGSSRDVTMDRSPTPERPRRTVPKRIRMGQGVKDDKGKGTGLQISDGNEDVDVGVLLATLTRENLLPILTSLITTHPQLKSQVVALIPRPSLETALQALELAAKKLRDEYPISIGPAHPRLGSPASFSSSYNGSTRSSPANFGFGFGINSPSFSPSPTGPPPEQSAGHHGMRDEYVIGRLRPHIADFATTTFSYLPYFSFSPSAAAAFANGSATLSASAQTKAHINDVFQFLANLTAHVVKQPSLAQAELLLQLMPRLAEEWKMWVTRLAHAANTEGIMFGEAMAAGWGRALDELVEAKVSGLDFMQEVLDRWIETTGWLARRVKTH